MLSDLAAKEKVVGLKQTRRSIANGTAVKVFLAGDADRRLTDPIAESCRLLSIPIVEEGTMAELGRACGVAVGTAAAALLKR